MARQGMATYRSSFSISAGGAGVFLELGGGADREIMLHKLFISKPTNAVLLTIEKHSALSTGGTPGTALTKVPLSTRSETSTASLVNFTAVPTPGASVGEILRDAVGTSDRVTHEFGERETRAPTAEAAAECFSIITDGASVIKGYIEWTEKSL